jgi:Bacterial protein of unknown function (DUF885)
VNATFVGVHDWDDRFPDYSEAGLAATQQEMEGLLGRFRTLPPPAAAGGVSPVEALDRELAEGFLEIDVWERGSPHGPAGNPCAFTGEALFGVIALLLRPFAPVAERVEHAIARMAAIPDFLAAAVRLRQAPGAWVDRALRECAGAAVLFERGIEMFLAGEDVRGHGVDPERVRAAARAAAAAFARFAGHLEREVRPNATGAYACGEAALTLLMRRGHGVASTPAEVRRLAEERAQEAEAALRDRASEAGFAGDWRRALSELAARHPTAERYYDRYTEIWETAREAAIEHRLVTWPDYPIRFVPRPRWTRDAAPFLYFLAYRAPAAYDRVPVVDYLVTPVETGMPPDEQTRRLRAANDAAITLNHVIHHGGLGHHVQNWFAYRAASRIGRVAAVDCASRIAMLCGGTMAEGWACYAVDLMEEIGFLSPLERCAQAHTRLRIALRAIADVALHTGAWTLADTASAYETRGGMEAAAAQAEAVKNSLFPATAMMYLLGVDGIHRLRREAGAGRDGGLRAFHDRLLACGSVPVARAAALLGEEGTRTP